MGSMMITAYVTVTLFMTALNIFISLRAFKKNEEHGETGRFLGYSGILASMINLAYLGSIMVDSYRVMSAFSSMYFCCIDWMLITLVHFTTLVTGTSGRRVYRGIRAGLCICAILDTLVLFLNVFEEVAIHYVDHGRNMVRYTYEMKLPYMLHLAFTYILVVLILYILIEKILTTPRAYRRQYEYIVASILLVVAVNALFLYVDGTAPFLVLDFSILGYSIGLYCLYWTAFEYRLKNMRESLSLLIFSDLDEGVVLFDYEMKLIMANHMAERLAGQVVLRDRMPMEDFLAAMDLPERNETSYSVQRGRIRVDYRQLMDDRESVIGSLFRLSDITGDTDPLTGFVLWEKFRKYVLDNPWKYEEPTAVVMMDIIGLDRVNRTFGRETGDQRIQNLAKILKGCLPDETLYIRGFEAHLIAVCRHMGEEELKELVEKVQSSAENMVTYSIASTMYAPPGEEPVILRVIYSALRSLQVKKLLDPRCAHSQTLTSLVRALQESDPDTEAHVRRTQKMGDMLGKRLGLHDVELAELQLLCLLHDIGKVGIPLEILNKPGRLTDAEWKVLRTHVEKGYQIAMSSDELKEIAPMILYHHERWDGRGYPEGLSGNSIPLLSRIISVVDAYDAMVNNRSYRRALSPEEAMKELLDGEGSQFDPFLVHEFLEMLKENPSLALGEKTGGEEPQVQHPMVHPDGESMSGNTTAVPYCRYILDVNDQIIEVDNAFEKITGYTRYDVMSRGLHQLDLIPRQEQTRYMLEVNNQLARNNLAYLEHDVQCKDGTIRRVYCMGKHYYDSAAREYRSEILVFTTMRTTSVTLNET